MALNQRSVKRYVAKIFLYGLVMICLAMRFAARKVLEGLPWLIAAFGALSFTFYAFGRQFFCKEDARLLITARLPQRENLCGRSLSLLVIELMLELREGLTTWRESFNR